MSQNDFNIANQGFPATRADLNSALQALASNSAGATAPSTTYAYQLWYDETTNLLKMRDSDNEGFITLAAFDQAAAKWEIRSSVIQAADSAGVVIKTDDGVARISVANDGAVSIDGNLAVDTITNEAGTGSPSLPNGLTVGGVNYPTTGPLSNRNKIINGAMVIDQRNAGAAVTPTFDAYTVDRWRVLINQPSKFSAQQDASVIPAGNAASLKITSLSAYSPVAADYFAVTQNVEGLNANDLDWGKATAKSVTLSFRVYSSLTGTFSGAIQNSAFDYGYVFTYSIASANTWTDVSVTISGPTAGTWLTNNGVGLRVIFSLGMGSDRTTGTTGSWQAANVWAATGSVNVVGTNGATWQITGVQLEAGTVATPFEHRSFGQELALCQRYFYSVGGLTFSVFSLGMAFSTTLVGIYVPLPVTMRSTPAVSVNGIRVADGSNVFAVTSASASTNETSPTLGFFTCTVSSGLTQFRPYSVQANNNAAAFVQFSSEL
jgi:hypothetical protein